jgi:hypothetical protein
MMVKTILSPNGFGTGIPGGKRAAEPRIGFIRSGRTPSGRAFPNGKSALDSRGRRGRLIPQGDLPQVH